jgi:hypothetical protein
MKTSHTTSKVKKPKAFTLKKSLAKKYANDPFFLAKANESNQLIETYGLPSTPRKVK